jgi:diaminobutyrate-2-oxoglutarate transaminase
MHDHVATFARNESEVRYYCRRLPNLLASATGALIRDSEGNTFIDFLSACGALNFGHNDGAMKRAAIRHIEADGIVAGLDLHTETKLGFVETFVEHILMPRGMPHKMQFPGPTGANCVEAAIKLARKVTGRRSIVAFTNAFHGMSVGALALSASTAARAASAAVLNGVVRLPFDGYDGADSRDLLRFRSMAADPSGGIEPVAAFIVETVQGEGGLNEARAEWLRVLARVAADIGALLIIDDIQAGCGRTGKYFSFERSGIVPDIVCLAKSISGFGLPMSLLLLKPEIDVWSPGEHNGTFRGNGLAFATATEAIHLWRSISTDKLPKNCQVLADWCAKIANEYPQAVRAKGAGMMRGIEFASHPAADRIASRAVTRGVLVECCGPFDEVLKLMPPLNIEADLLREGLDRISSCIAEERELSEFRPGSSERYDAALDGHHNGRDAVRGSQFAHSIA